MSDWLMRVIRAEAKNLIALAADDDELRAGLRALANEILAATEDPGIETAAAHVEADRSPAVEPAGSDGDKTDIVEPLRKLTLGMTVRSKTEAGPSPRQSRVCVALRANLRSWKQTVGGKQRRPAGRPSGCFEFEEGNDCRELDAAVDPIVAEWSDMMIDWLCSALNRRRAPSKPIFRCSMTLGAASRHWSRRWRLRETALRKAKARRPSNDCCRSLRKRDPQSGPP